MPLIKAFSELSKGDASIAGGKGASLGEMTHVGIPVPPGFVILSNAFERFIEETDLNAEIDAVFHSVDPKEMHTVEHASEKIQALILKAQMPADIAREIQTFYTNLDSQYVAVRSSATAEDSASAAWAGQLDSYLNTTEETLLTNVQKCWASLFTPRAIFYRFEKGLHTTKISVAVVVQKMVASEVSGIAFSVHPVTEDRNQLIIEAGFGLGEAIVSGSITPDSYVIEKEPRRVIDTNVNTQTRALYRVDSGGNEWKDILEPKASSQVLTEPQILELSELILRIERHYGFPCDIEWAFEGGKFYIVQSRPITTLTSSKTENSNQSVKQWHESETLLTFEINNIPLITEFLISYYYMPSGTLLGYGKGVLRHHVLRSVVARLNERGRELFYDETAIRKAATNFRLSAEIFRTACDDITTHGVNVMAMKRLLALAGDCIRAYEPFDTWYTDGAYEKRDVPAVARALAVAEEEKNALREEFGQLFLEPKKMFLAVLEHVSQKVGAPYKDLVWYLPEEIEAACSGELLAQSRLQARHQAYVRLQELDGHITLLEGDEAEAYLDAFYAGTSQTGTLLRGVCAHAGSRKPIRGTVRVINSDYLNFSNTERKMDAMQLGDILVSPTTAPDLMPALKKAAAIVTDVGGMLSHAAIVARELDTPCIVGTGFASRVLKDGDLVEADADNGVVRIIEKRLSPNPPFKIYSAWSKNWDSQFSLLACDIGLKVYLTFKKEFGAALIPVVMHREGHSSCYYADEQLDAFTTQLWKLYTRDPDILNRWITEAKKGSDRLAKLIEEGGKLAALDDFCTCVDDFGGPNFAIREVTNRFTPDEHKEEIDAVTEYRKYTELFYFNMDLYLEKIVNEVVQKTGYAKELIQSLTLPELTAYVTGAPLPSKEIAQARYEKSVAWFVDGNFAYYNGDLDEAIGILQGSYDGSGSFTGVKAYGGKTTGIVKTITSYDASVTITDENILVTGMTDPRFIHLMHTAKGFVTDAGGMLSHAAIVARELKKPCIVGTKIATQVLHDGDLVEVDADNGVVRILERA